MMTEFIANRIIQAAKISTENGINKYKAYFVNTSLYEAWRADVNTILELEGYSACIVA
ncbi:MAG: hypothetical protein AB7E42_02615 [Anaerotignaceae bacterium]|jgi:hypothetical protein